MNDLIVQLRDPRQRFLFQGSRPFALSIANALEAKGREVERLKADIKFLCSGAAHHVDDVAEIERLRGLLSRARNSVVADARAAYNTDLPLTASNLNALVARIDAALGPPATAPEPALGPGE
jgi:hypothetical protein